jgi:hypothetical protein
MAHKGEYRTSEKRIFLGLDFLFERTTSGDIESPSYSMNFVMYDRQRWKFMRWSPDRVRMAIPKGGRLLHALDICLDESAMHCSWRNANDQKGLDGL